LPQSANAEFVALQEQGAATALQPGVALSLTGDYDSLGE
jgi:hypothetical protein